jgi:hypothetical protein
MLNNDALRRDLDRRIECWDVSASASFRAFEDERTAGIELVDRPLVLIGATPYTRAFIKQAGAFDLVAVCDNNAGDTDLGGIEIIREGALGDLKRRHPRLLAVQMVESKGAAAHFGACCAALGIDWLSLLHAYRRSGFEFPAMQAKFYEGLVESVWSRRDQWDGFANMLDDELSRGIFHSVLLFRLTGERRYLEAANLASIAAGEPAWLSNKVAHVYVDGGAYDGDTVLRFVERNGTTYDQIYAFEPDADNFAQLEARTRHLPRLRRFRQGLYSDRFKAPWDRSPPIGRACAFRPITVPMTCSHFRRKSARSIRTIGSLCVSSRPGFTTPICTAIELRRSLIISVF